MVTTHLKEGYAVDSTSDASIARVTPMGYGVGAMIIPPKQDIRPEQMQQTKKGTALY